MSIYRHRGNNPQGTGRLLKDLKIQKFKDSKIQRFKFLNF
jgi:hypothetical protein